MSDLADDPMFGPPLVQGAWQVRMATDADKGGVLRLRAAAFRRDPSANDEDIFDARSHHLWVGQAGQGPCATVRLMLHHTPADLLSGYAAQFYDLTRLASAGTPVLELGRLCTSSRDASTYSLRLLWAGVARTVMNTGAKRLIGCTSFPTTDPKQISAGLAILAAQHIGPQALLPGVKARASHALSQPNDAPDAAGKASLPALLRFYLMLGGWVSDHLVIDDDLQTSHVFTCVDVDTMPAGRRRVLSRLAALKSAQV